MAGLTLSGTPLDELDQVALGVLQGRDRDGVVVGGSLHELDPRRLQALPVSREIVGGQADHVPRRVGVAAPDLAVGPEPKAGPTGLAQDDEARRLDDHLEPQHVPVERQQVVQIRAPDRRRAQSLDHRGLLMGSGFTTGFTIWSNGAARDRQDPGAAACLARAEVGVDFGRSGRLSGVRTPFDERGGEPMKYVCLVYLVETDMHALY